MKSMGDFDQSLSAFCERLRDMVTFKDFLGQTDRRQEEKDIWLEFEKRISDCTNQIKNRVETASLPYRQNTIQKEESLTGEVVRILNEEFEAGLRSLRNNIDNELKEQKKALPACPAERPKSLNKDE
mmetsp:Transcript_24768/g.39769  ORF Transcript_24768/g.39769 Transcript_24768/m.39769 type:complete len:127 (+) Transcript_24768:1-381(+)